MEFFDDEDDQRPVPEEIIQPVPTHPFPFLRLPREIRNLIYGHALVRPGVGHYVEPARTCFMHHKGGYPSSWTSYWGKEKSTRLFRVSHQVSSEATEIFYSTFPFHFPVTIDVALVHDTLRDTLPLRARRLIREIGFMILIRGIQHSFTAQDDEEPRLAIEAAVGLLPNIQRIEVTIACVGHDVPEYQVMEVVDRVLKELGPLRDMPGVIICEGSNDTKQRAHIINEVRKALGRQ